MGNLSWMNLQSIDHSIPILTSAYIPRLSSSPHPNPQLTTPARVAAPLLRPGSEVTRGPPLSP